MRLIQYIAVLGLMINLSVPTAADDCPEISDLRQNLQAHKYITVDFIQTTHSEIFQSVDTLSGSLWAGGNGRFRLDMPGQIIVSNGTLYWSYSEENQQVMVDSVVKMGAWNPLTLLYDPEGVYRCQGQSQDSAQLEFSMIALDSLTEPQTFSLLVSNKDYRPLQVVYFDDNDSRIEVRLEGYSRLENLPDSLFEFKPGPKVEIILMP
ncbi:MAG: outer membrane lipoprotein carrier protein LolA [FCB group bacterium]|nr:outer membrane lipoprotein carrier protein LolA [FCB group bacterium]